MENQVRAMKFDLLLTPKFPLRLLSAAVISVKTESTRAKRIKISKFVGICRSEISAFVYNILHSLAF